MTVLVIVSIILIFAVTCICILGSFMVGKEADTVSADYARRRRQERERKSA